MRPFEYKAYVPDTGTIAELMLRSGAIQSDQILRAAQIAANAQREAGTAEANAVAQRGQIYGQTIGNITQAIGSIPGNIEADKRTKLAQQEIGLRIDAAQRQAKLAAQQDADRQNMIDAFTVQPPGGGPNDAEYQPLTPPRPPMAATPPGGGPNDSEIYPPPVVPPLTPGLTPQTLPGSLGAMIAPPPPQAGALGGGPNDAEYQARPPLPPMPTPSPTMAPPASGPMGAPGAPAPSGDGAPVPTTTLPPGNAAPARPSAADATAQTRAQILARLSPQNRAVVQKQWDEQDKSKLELQKLQDEHSAKINDYIGKSALTIAQNGYDPVQFGLEVDHARDVGWITPEEHAAIKAQVQDRPDQVKAITDRMINASEDARKAMEGRYVATGENAGVLDKLTGKITPGTPKADPASMQEVSLNGKNVVATYDPKAKTLTYQGRDIINDPTLGPKVTPRDPLAQQMSQERLDALREGAKPLDISADVQTTVSGGKYVDVSMYSAGKERDKAVAAARAAGVVPVSKEQASSLADIDTARQNQAKILAQIQDTLPKDASGRPVAAVTTTLSKLFQTNDQLAAFGTWRTAAINSMRATAGSKGLRINRAEIDAAIENDIPKLTDTLGVAQQKVKNINAMLDSVESSIITRNRQTGAPGTAAPTAGAAPGTTQTIGGYKVTALP